MAGRGAHRILSSPKAGPETPPCASPTAPAGATTAPSRGSSSPSMRCELLVLLIGDGEGDHLKGGGGVTGAEARGSRANLALYGNYPSTILRMVPLPTASRQGGQKT